MTDSDAPPLPELTNKPRNAKPEAQNGWLTLVETVPLSAEGMPYAGRTHSVLPGTRSPFRTGCLSFDTDGVTIDGMVVKPFPKWFPILSFASGIAQILVQVVARFGKRSGVSKAALFCCIVLFVGLVFIPIIFRNRFDRFRMPAKMLLDWDSLQAVQVDPHLRHITFVFHSFAVPGAKDKIRPREFLFLNKLDPATIAGIVTTIREYAPDVVLEEPLKTHSIRWNWVSIVILAVLGVVSVGILLVAYLRLRAIL